MIKPIIEIVFLTVGGISFLVSPSMEIIIRDHPSKPGKGNKLKIARLTEIKAQI
jgi:hypothetical protein